MSLVLIFLIPQTHIIEAQLKKFLERVARLKGIANDLGIKLSQLAVAWILRQPGVSSAIVGACRFLMMY